MLGVCRSDTLDFSVCVVVSLGCLITYVQYIHRIGTPHCVCALCNGEPAATCIASRGVLILFRQSCVAYTAKIVLPWVQSPMHHILHLSYIAQLTDGHITYAVWVIMSFVKWLRYTCVSCSFRLQTSTLFGECHKWLFRAPLHCHLLLPRELQPLPEVHPIHLRRAHCVPWVSSQQLLQWVQCGVHHPQPDEVCELPLHCHCTYPQPKGKSCCRGRHSHVK